MVWLESVAVVFGLLCVWLSVRQHIGCWPTGLGMVLLYIFIFFDARLYSDVLLQVVYVFLQIYGWYAWLYGGPGRTQLAVSRLPPSHGGAWVIVAVVGTAALGHGMHRWTDASLPYIDAFAAVASLIAQWLMGRKVLESWPVWIVVNVVSIGMYLAKALYLTAGLNGVFLAMSVWGWWEWSREWRKTVTG